MVILFFSLAEALSDRVLKQALRLTNVSNVENKINNMKDSLDDLLDHVEGSIQNSEDTIRLLNDLRDSVKNIKVN